MTITIQQQAKWQQMFARQAINNAEHWLQQLQANLQNPAFIVHEYDNLLRALEFSLQSTTTFDLALAFIEALFLSAFNFADWDRWEAYLTRALQMSQQLDNELAQAQLSNLLGDVSHSKGKIDEAKMHYQVSLQSYRHLNDMPSYAHLLIKLAALYASLGKIERGFSLCQEALTIASHWGKKRLLGNVNLTLSSLYLDSGQWEASLAAAQNAHQLFQQVEDFAHGRRALVNQCYALARLGQWELIGDMPARLEKTLAESGDIHTLGKLKINLGCAAIDQGDLLRAEAFFQEALHIYTLSLSKKEMALVFNNLGDVYTQMKEWDTAEDFLQRAVALFEELNDMYHWANSMDNLAILYQAQGDTAVACQLLEKSLIRLQVQEPTPQTTSLLQEMRHRLEAYQRLF